MQQHLIQMQPMMAAYYPNNVTTDHIQQYLDENKSLILRIVENQNSGKLSECAENQAKLQRNLMYLAAIADSQPNPPTLHSQYPGGAGGVLPLGSAHYLQQQQQAQQMTTQPLMAAQRSAMYYGGAHPYSSLQQQAAAAAGHLGMSSSSGGGGAGMMLQGEPHGGGGFPEFVRGDVMQGGGGGRGLGGGGKHEGGSSEGRSGGEGAHYLKHVDEGN